MCDINKYYIASRESKQKTIINELLKSGVMMEENIIEKALDGKNLLIVNKEISINKGGINLDEDVEITQLCNPATFVQADNTIDAIYKFAQLNNLTVEEVINKFDAICLYYHGYFIYTPTPIIELEVKKNQGTGYSFLNSAYGGEF